MARYFQCGPLYWFRLSESFSVEVVHSVRFHRSESLTDHDLLRPALFWAKEPSCHPPGEVPAHHNIHKENLLGPYQLQYIPKHFCPLRDPSQPSTTNFCYDSLRLRSRQTVNHSPRFTATPCIILFPFTTDRGILNMCAHLLHVLMNPSFQIAPRHTDIRTNFVSNACFVICCYMMN